MNGSAWAPLPWQQQAWAQLAQARADDRLAHALLVAGPRGVGKRHFVQGMAAALLCESPAADGRACGRCRGCVQHAAGQHPNFLRLEPEEGKRDIAIESVRALIERLTLSSHYGGRKVAVLDPADTLNASGVNALLKTVEEPTAGSHLILVTERLMTLAATLRSRCQILRLGAPPAAQAETWLAQQHPDVPATRRQAYAHAPLRLAETQAEGWAERREAWRRVLVAASDGQAAAAIKGLDRIKKEEAEALLAWLIEETAAALRASVSGSHEPSALGRLGAARLSELSEQAVDGLRALAGNANPQLLVESLMIRLAQRNQ